MPLRREDGAVEIFLRRREAAADRKGARDVGDIVAVFAAGVHEDHGVGLQQVVVLRVVDDACVRTACYDGNVGLTGASIESEGVVKERGKVILLSPGPAHGRGEGAAGSLACEAHVGYLGWGFDTADLVHHIFQGFDMRVLKNFT